MWFSVGLLANVGCRSLCHTRDVAPLVCHSAQRVPGDLRCMFMCSVHMRVCLWLGWPHQTQNPLGSALWPTLMGILVGYLAANSLCQVHFWQLKKSLWPASLATVCPLLPSLVSPVQEGDSAGSGVVCLLKDKRFSKTGEFWKKMQVFSEKREYARI